VSAKSSGHKYQIVLLSDCCLFTDRMFNDAAAVAQSVNGCPIQDSKTINTLRQIRIILPTA